MVPIIILIVIVLFSYLFFKSLGGYEGGSLRIRDETGEIAKSIKSGKKTVEIRKNSDFVNKDIEGSTLTFEMGEEDIEVHITKIEKYKDLDTALKSIDTKDIYPSMDKKDAKELLEKYNSKESVEYWRGEKGDGIIAIHFLMDPAAKTKDTKTKTTDTKAKTKATKTKDAKATKTKTKTKDAKATKTKTKTKGTKATKK